MTTGEVFHTDGILLTKPCDCGAKPGTFLPVRRSTPAEHYAMQNINAMQR